MEQNPKKAFHFEEKREKENEEITMDNRSYYPPGGVSGSRGAMRFGWETTGLRGVATLTRLRF